MSKLTASQFVAKWSQIQQKETAVSQSHFNDICRLVGHPTPLEYDPAGQTFVFEAKTVKPDGQKGFADVYFHEKFIWEYKGPHKDLGKAYQQLLLYRDALNNPPLLITSDIHTIEIHTNFNNYPRQTHIITLDDIAAGPGLEKLRWVFYDRERFRPAKDQREITKATADTFLAVADAMKQHQRITGEAYSPEQLAHFLVRLLFALFAEDMGLLPDNLFTQIVQRHSSRYENLQPVLGELFRKMRGGGYFGLWPIRHFNGTLFDDDFVPAIPYDLGQTLLRAAEQDWSSIDPSIFGTLFERIIDESKRAQLGAHYTSEADILLIVEPVLLAPLKARWEGVRAEAAQLLLLADNPANRAHAHDLLAAFAAEIAAVRVLDPACGSGNFLYVALRELLDLQKEVIAYAARRDLPPIPLSVGPEQLHGIEINPYAHELAQITVWIGYLQWRRDNGFGEMADPILRPLRHIQRMDAIVAYDENGRFHEPAWPPADVIIGNPPFLGEKKMRTELGDQYVIDLMALYAGRLPASDLVCYWFEKARAKIAEGKAQRVGLIATNSIRGGANREVLKRIKQTGDIFLAWSDNPWILDGAAVRVSIIGFDNGQEASRLLDGQPVLTINPDLTQTADLTQAKTLNENLNLAFMGVTPGGPFDMDADTARKLLAADPKNQEVIRPYYNALDITQRVRNVWTIDFGTTASENDAASYPAVYEYAQKVIKPARLVSKQPQREKDLWWIYTRSRPEMRKAIQPLKRYIITPLVSKHRIYAWSPQEVIPANLINVIARDDDYFFGVLHSRPHELWALRLGTSLEDRPRYTPSTTFETYPFPWPPGQEPAEADSPLVKAIADWSRALVAWRETWLNPPPPAAGTIDVAYNAMLKNRTLTNLYNGLQYYRQNRALFLQSEFDKVTRKSVSRAQIAELDDLHRGLETAVFAAYNWPPTLTDEEILERLLALNLQRAQRP